MRVVGLTWLGTRTPRFEEMVEFAERTLGVRPAFAEEGITVFELPDGALFEVFSEEHPGGGHPEGGVVAGFRVDDVEQARAELEAAGVEVSPLENGTRDAWAYFRAPDGNLYEIVGSR